jgi:hypothetical protein
MDIPEFYELARELFTPEEASVAAAMPKGFCTAEQLSEPLKKSREEIEATLQTMTMKGLLLSFSMEGTEAYSLPPFVPGIFEYQFMRGTKTEKDRKLARLISNYRKAVDAINGIPKISFPTTRVITVDQKIEAGNKVHTYDQMSAYVESADPISVCTCFCRHEAELIDPNDTCGNRNDVCMQFGMGARFAIDKGTRIRLQLLRGPLRDSGGGAGAAEAGACPQLGLRAQARPGRLQRLRRMRRSMPCHGPVHVRRRRPPDGSGSLHWLWCLRDDLPD